MPDRIDLLKHLYDRFNARDIDAVLASLHPDVVWANGMEGGHVHRHDGIREYWTRQWSMFDPRVDPISHSEGVHARESTQNAGFRSRPGCDARAFAVWRGRGRNG